MTLDVFFSFDLKEICCHRTLYCKLLSVYEIKHSKNCPTTITAATAVVYYIGHLHRIYNTYDEVYAITVQCSLCVLLHLFCISVRTITNSDIFLRGEQCIHSRLARHIVHTLSNSILCIREDRQRWRAREREHVL